MKVEKVRYEIVLAAPASGIVAAASRRCSFLEKRRDASSTLSDIDLVKAGEGWSRLVKPKSKIIFYEYAPAGKAGGPTLFNQHRLKRSPQPSILEGERKE